MQYKSYCMVYVAGLSLPWKMIELSAISSYSKTCKSFSIFLEMPFLFKLLAWRLNFHEFKIFETSIKLCIRPR